MKRIIMTVTAVMLSALLLLIPGSRSVSADSGISAAELSAEVDRHIALGEYSKAAELIEQYPQITGIKDFDKAKNTLLVHFTGTAKEYYVEAMSFWEFNEEGETFDRAGRISPAKLGEELSDDAKTVIDRTVIQGGAVYDKLDPKISVRIELFGKTAVYPADDIRLGKTAKPSGEYIDSDELLQEVELNIGIYRYGAAAALIEKYPNITDDPAFNKVKNTLLGIFSKIVENEYNRQATYYFMGHVGDDERYDKNGYFRLENIEAKLSPEAMAVFDRISLPGYERIRSTDDYKKKVDIRLELFGTAIIYPPDDITLDKRTRAAYSYTDSAALLNDVEFNIATMRYAAAVKLMEENPRLSSEPEFDGAREALQKYFEQEAKNMYIHTAIYLVDHSLEECEGYDPKSHRFDPHTVISYMNAADRRVINRVSMTCNPGGDPYIEVKIGFCGMAAYYPYPPTNPPAPKKEPDLTRLQANTNNTNQLQIQVTPNNLYPRISP